MVCIHIYTYIYIYIHIYIYIYIYIYICIYTKQRHRALRNNHAHFICELELILQHVNTLVYILQYSFQVSFCRLASDYRAQCSQVFQGKVQSVWMSL